MTAIRCWNISRLTLPSGASFTTHIIIASEIYCAAHCPGIFHALSYSVELVDYFLICDEHNWIANLWSAEKWQVVNHPKRLAGRVTTDLSAQISGIWLHICKTGIRHACKTPTIAKNQRSLTIFNASFQFDYQFVCVFLLLLLFSSFPFQIEWVIIHRVIAGICFCFYKIRRATWWLRFLFFLHFSLFEDAFICVGDDALCLHNMFVLTEHGSYCIAIVYVIQFLYRGTSLFNT